LCVRASARSRTKMRVHVDRYIYIDTLQHTACNTHCNTHTFFCYARCVVLCVRPYVHICVHAYVYVYVRVRVYARASVCVCVCVCVCVYVWLCALLYGATHCNTLQHTATHCNTHLAIKNIFLEVDFAVSISIYRVQNFQGCSMCIYACIYVCT